MPADHPPSAVIATCGLPQSGKTTFLAALWHLLTSGEVKTKYRLGSLAGGELSHLNAIAERWCDAKQQDRTKVADQMVAFRLLDSSASEIGLSFPDVSGELYREMWEERQCDLSLAEHLRASKGLLFFVHADTIYFPNWVVNMAALGERLGIPIQPGQEVKWSARLSPTQVQIVDLLQLIASPALEVSTRRLAIMLSAWDKVEAEGLSPDEYLTTRLPMLRQYLSNGADGWVYKVFGVSAQGADYEHAEERRVEGPDPLVAIRALDRPSDRISVVTAKFRSHDLTEPLAWLME